MVAVLAGMLVGCTCSTTESAPSGGEPVEDAAVIAVSGDLGVRVVRQRAEWVVRRGEAVVARLAAPDSPRERRAAISLDGTWLVHEVETGVRRVRIPTGQTEWEAEASVFGTPEISPDGQTVAVPANGFVTLFDARTGRLVRHLSGGSELVEIGARPMPIDSPLGTARTVRFSPNGRLLVVSSESSRLTRANRTLFVLEVATGALRAELSGHEEPARALWLGNERIFTIDGAGRARVFELDGTLSAETSAGLPSDHVAGDGERVMLADRTRFVIWRIEDDRVREGEHRYAGVHAIALTDNGGRIVDGRGIVRVLPDASTERSLEVARRERDQVLMDARRALYLLDEHPEQAARALGPFATREDEPLLRAAYVYACARTDDEQQSLLERLAARGFDLARPERASAVLDLSAFLLAETAVAGSAELWGAWRQARRGSDQLDGDDERARALGLAIVDTLAALEAPREVVDGYVRAMLELWPESSALALLRARSLADVDPDEAARTLQSVRPANAEEAAELEELQRAIANETERVRRHHDPTGTLAMDWVRAREGGDLETWAALLETCREVAPEELASAADEARRSLRADDAEALQVIGRAYYEAGRLDDALVQYRQAIRLLRAVDGESIAANMLQEEVDDIRQQVRSLPELRAAVDADPTDSFALDAYFFALAHLRRSELVPEIRRVRSSMGAGSSSTWASLGFAYRSAYHYEDARECLRRALDLAGPHDVTDAIQQTLVELDERITRSRVSPSRR